MFRITWIQHLRIWL